jgi:chromosome partitioning protein
MFNIFKRRPMAIKIGIVSQKGGVGKSALCRLVAREYAAAGWEVKIADMDLKQGTSYNWHSRRLERGIEPNIAVEQFARISQVLKIENGYDMVIIDGAPHSSVMTLEIAKESDIVILPTGTPVDDLEPTVKLAHELKQKGISKDKIALALCRVGDSIREIEEATDYIKLTGYYTLPGEIPEKVAYKQALDSGRVLSETPFATLNQKAQEIVGEIEKRINKLNKGV